MKGTSPILAWNGSYLAGEILSGGCLYLAALGSFTSFTALSFLLNYLPLCKFPNISEDWIVIKSIKLNNILCTGPTVVYVAGIKLHNVIPSTVCFIICTYVYLVSWTLQCSVLHITKTPERTHNIGRFWPSLELLDKNSIPSRPCTENQ